VLLSQLCPGVCDRSALTDTNLQSRAEKFLVSAEKIGCRKYLTTKSILDGNAKLNFAFVANLFNNHPGLDPLSDAEMVKLDESLFSAEGDREARGNV
jgi:plastin-1